MSNSEDVDSIFKDTKENMFLINGSTFGSFFFCQKKAFYILNGIRADADNFYLSDGKENAKTSYANKKIKEITIGHSKIDIIDDNFIIEVKRSLKHVDTDKFQLFFYMLLYYFEFNIKMDGKIISNIEKKHIIYLFDDIPLLEIRDSIETIDKIITFNISSLEIKKNKGKHCQFCAFGEFCYAN